MWVQGHILTHPRPHPQYPHVHTPGACLCKQASITYLTYSVRVLSHLCYMPTSTIDRKWRTECTVPLNQQYLIEASQKNSETKNLRKQFFVLSPHDTMKMTYSKKDTTKETLRVIVNLLSRSNSFSYLNSNEPYTEPSKLKSSLFIIICKNT